ncbi:MAG: YIP1 family protein [Lentimicrobiaceae bacterium]|nr:YIP1 family protein [Lentimicrobiaceae bacterium]
MKFCPNCGAELKPEAKFCAACGTPIAASTPPPAQSQPVYQEPVYEQAREAGNAFSEAITGKTNLIQRVINILTKPKQEWAAIANEEPNTMKLIGGYALILALIPALSSFIKYGVIGFTFMGYTSRSIASGIQTGLIQFLSAIVGVYLLAWVIDMLAPTFDSQKNFGRSLQLAVYSSTPQWVAGILLLIGTGFSVLIMLIGLYAIYLLAVGMPIIKSTPKEKVVGYVVLTIVAMIVIGLLMALVFGAVMGIFFVSSAGGFRF